MRQTAGSHFRNPPDSKAARPAAAVHTPWSFPASAPLIPGRLRRPRAALHIQYRLAAAVIAVDAVGDDPSPEAALVAQGVRRAAGEQAKVLNDLIDKLFSEEQVDFKELKELLGHQPAEVFAGAVLGIFIGIGCCLWIY